MDDSVTIELDRLIEPRRPTQTTDTEHTAQAPPVIGDVEQLEMLLTARQLDLDEVYVQRAIFVVKVYCAVLFMVAMTWLLTTWLFTFRMSVMAEKVSIAATAAIFSASVFFLGCCIKIDFTLVRCPLTTLCLLWLTMCTILWKLTKTDDYRTFKLVMFSLEEWILFMSIIRDTQMILGGWRYGFLLCECWVASLTLYGDLMITFVIYLMIMNTTSNIFI